MRWSAEMEIEAQHYFQPRFEQLREQPDDTLLSDLVNSEIPEWGRPLNDNELHAEMMADLFVGGSETTTNALAAGVVLLIEQPEVWQQLKSDPDRYLPTFVEEVLRLESPVQGLLARGRRRRRAARRDDPGRARSCNLRYARRPTATSGSSSARRSSTSSASKPRIAPRVRCRHPPLPRRAAGPPRDATTASGRWSTGSTSSGSSRARTRSRTTRTSSSAR